MPECPAGTHCVNAKLHDEWAYALSPSNDHDPLYLCLEVCDDGPRDCPAPYDFALGEFCSDGECHLGYCKSHIGYIWYGEWVSQEAGATSATTSDSDSG